MAFPVFAAIVLVSILMSFGIFILMESIWLTFIVLISPFMLLALIISHLFVKPPWHKTGLGPVLGRAGRWYDGKTTNPLVDYGVEFEEFETPIGHNGYLRGWHIKGDTVTNDKTGEKARIGIVFVHGGARDRRAFMRHIPMFHKRGYGCIMFDCREHGISSSDSLGIGWGSREHEDTAAIAAYTERELGYEKIVLIGTSQGGASCILAAALHDKQVAAVIAENPYTCRKQLMGEVVQSYLGPPLGMSIMHDAFKYLVISMSHMMVNIPHNYPNPKEVIHAIAPRPVLFMHGTNDKLVGSHHSEELFEKAQEPKQLWILDGAEHTALYDHDPVEWENTVFNFLTEHNL